MTSEEIMIKVIEKALANGWKPVDLNVKTPEQKKWAAKWIPRHIDWTSLIFDIPLAKALWGNDKNLENWKRTGTYLPGKSTPEYEIKMAPWAYHLQRMAIVSDRIKYLEKNI